MAATARTVRAERNRRRLPPRRAVHRWTRRIAGLLATAAFLGVGVASYKMIAPDHSASESPAATPTAAPGRHHKAAHHRHRPKGLTKAQKVVRASAVAELRTQGYTPVKLSDYDARATFRVLIGRPTADAGGGAYAFFFYGGRYLGRDSVSPSAGLKVLRHGKRHITLSYGTCCPPQHVHVRFQLDAGNQIQALDPIPPSSLRVAQR